MTDRDGFPRDMDPFALDALTAERLVTGAVDVGDAPPEYQGVATAFQALRQAPDRSELLGASAAVNRIAAAIGLERRAGVRRSRRSATRVARLAAASVVACCLALTGGLAAVGALPESAQGVASAVLSRVGISVPTGGNEKPADDRAPASTSVPAAPPTSTSVTPPPNANGSPPAPDPASSAPPHGNSQGDSPGTRSRGTPPSTANGKGKEQAPDDTGTSNAGNGQSNR
jgi:hypothetical protein